MSSPKSLHKAEEQSIMDMVEVFLNQYAYILLPIFIVLLVFFIIALVIAFIDFSSAHQIAMLESGNYYNHLKDVI